MSRCNWKHRCMLQQCCDMRIVATPDVKLQLEAAMYMLNPCTILIVQAVPSLYIHTYSEFKRFVFCSSYDRARCPCLIAQIR